MDYSARDAELEQCAARLFEMCSLDLTTESHGRFLCEVAAALLMAIPLLHEEQDQADPRFVGTGFSVVYLRLWPEIVGFTPDAVERSTIALKLVGRLIVPVAEYISVPIPTLPAFEPEADEPKQGGEAKDRP
jgi:hypothetical protein